MFVYALSVSSFVHNVGSDAGFAAILGLALLILLFFAQMRETRTLRERLEESEQRAGELEGQLRRLAARPVSPAAPPVVRPPSFGVRPAAAGAEGPSASVLAARGHVLLGAPAGVAAPALNSATRSIPAPAAPAAAGGALASGERVALSTGAASSTAGAGTVAGAVAGAVTGAVAGAVTGAVPGAVTGAGAGAGARERPSAARASTPVHAAAPQEGLLAAPLTAAAIGGNGRAHATLAATPASRSVAAAPTARPGPRPASRQGAAGDQPPRSPLIESLSRRERSRSRRVLPVVGALIVVAVVAFVLVDLVHGAKPAPASRTARGHSAAATLSPRKVRVAVLNGTAIYRLAADVSSALGRHGYRLGAVANAASQTATTTSVAYLPGERADAELVALTLGLPRSAVQAAGSATLSAACSAPTGAVTTASPTAGSCGADVIVVAGSDLARYASSSSSS